MSFNSGELIAKTYRHDLRSPYNVIRMTIADDDVDQIGYGDLSEDQKQEFEEFAGLLSSVVRSLEAKTSVRYAEEEIRKLADYDSDLPGEPGEYVEEIKGLSDFVSGYLDQCEVRGIEDSRVPLDEVLRVFDNYDAEIDYGGAGNEMVVGDPGLCLVANTIGMNWESYAEVNEGSKMWVEVDGQGGSEGEEDVYVVNIFDNGPGIPGDMDPEKIFEKGVGENTGLGLHLAQEITEGFGGSLGFSEDLASRQGGFGLEWRLKKAGQ